jgi:hypothetical protein
LGVASRAIGTVEADVAIAFATMVDGLGLSELRAIGKPLEQSSPRLGPLEPDLIGEFCAMEALRGDPDNSFAEPPHGWMPETAWQVRGDAMADLVMRATQNFPGHTSVERIAILVEGVQESWLRWAFDALPMQGVAAVREKLLSAAVSDPDGAAKAFAKLTLLATSWLRSGVIEPLLVATLLCDLAALHAAQPAESVLRKEWAESVIMFAGCRRAEDPDSCGALLNDLAALHAAHPAEPALREAYAMLTRP